jgi:2-oxoglutarate ferredoxin oxidoreductase subunit alpha
MGRRRELMQGDEASAEGAIYAGCRFFAGYPITPSTEIAEVMARRLPQVGGKFIQMEDEIASMGAIIGASLAGVKSMTATSGPGFSLKQENIGFACLCEVPCVIVNVMRGGPSTGLPTLPSQADVMQARWGTHGDHPIIALCPSSVQEAFDLTVECFNLSERYRVPVIFLMDEVIGHMREAIVIREPGEIPLVERKRPNCPPEEYLPYDHPPDDINPMADFGTGYRYHVTGLSHNRKGFPTSDPDWIQADGERLLRKITRNRDDIVSYDEFAMEDAEICVIAYGASARSAKDAIKQLRANGLKVGLFRPITLWPFPDREVRERAERVKAIVMVEMNLGQMVLEVERCTKGIVPIDGVFRADGEAIHPDRIVAKIEEVAKNV